MTNKTVLVAIFKFKSWMILKMGCRHFHSISLDFQFLDKFPFLNTEHFYIETEGVEVCREER